MVGAEGSPRALRTVAHLAQLDLDAQLVVICGHNEQLRQRMERLSARMPLRAVAFIDNVAELMRTADVLVTKAGGLTLAEAFCCGVPVVVHDVLPGQEAGNLDYVLGHQAVEYAPTPTRLGQLVTELYADPARRAALATSGARLAQPDATRRIVANVLKRLSDPPSA
jgi:processive 1,2-diacylglycerol beta-glucosyltransferase